MRLVTVFLLLFFSGHLLASSPTPGDELGMYLMYKHGVSSQQAQQVAEKYDRYYEARRAEEYRRFKGQAIVDFSSNNRLNQSSGVTGPGYSIDFDEWYERSHRKPHGTFRRHAR